MASSSARRGGSGDPGADADVDPAAGVPEPGVAPASDHRMPVAWRGSSGAVVPAASAVSAVSVGSAVSAVSVGSGARSGSGDVEVDESPVSVPGGRSSPGSPGALGLVTASGSHGPDARRRSHVEGHVRHVRGPADLTLCP